MYLDIWYFQRVHSRRDTLITVMWKHNDVVPICILQDKVPTVLRIYRDTLITVMKASIKSTVAEMLPVLISRPIDSDSVTGERAADSDGLIFFS